MKLNPSKLLDRILESPLTIFLSILILSSSLTGLSFILNRNAARFLQKESYFDYTFSSYFLIVFDITRKIKEELILLINELDASAAELFIYTGDLNYRARVTTTEDNNRVEDQQFVPVTIDEVYKQQLEDHVYNRCSYFKVEDLPNGDFKSNVVSEQRRHVFTCPILTEKGLLGYLKVGYNSLLLPYGITEIKNKMKLSVSNIELDIDPSKVDLDNFSDEELFVPPTSSEFRGQLLKSIQDFFKRKELVDNTVVTIYYFNPSKTNISPLIRLNNNDRVSGFIPGRNPFQFTGPSLRQMGTNLINKECYKVENAGNNLQLDKYKIYLDSYSAKRAYICPIIRGDGEVIGAAEIVDMNDGIYSKQDNKKYNDMAKELANYVREDVFLYLYLN